MSKERPLVFLSYARADAEPMAARLEEDLRARELDVWRDRTRLVSGTSWEEQCEEAIAGSDVMLALLSPLGVRGDNRRMPGQTDSVCLYEVSYARHHNIPVVPALVATCDLPLTLCRLHCEDLRHWGESEAFRLSAVDRLVESIRAAARGEVRQRHDLLPTWDFLPFLSERRQHFTGRDWLFEKLQDVLGGNSRAVLISGDPGIGKSAIVAELVFTNPGGRVLAYHCCQWNVPRTRDPGRFVAHVAGMLASRLEEFAALLDEELRSEPLPMNEPMTAFYRGIVAPLSRLTRPPDGPRFLLIDALDESLGLDDGTGIVPLVAQYLGQLPEWLRVVATTRGDPDVLSRLDGLNAIELRAADALNRNDVANHIRQRLATPPLADRSAPPHVEDKLTSAADGNFLVARMLLDALSKRTLAFEDIDNLPPGLGGVYQTFFERMFPVARSPGAIAYESVALVLAALVGAREPLDYGDLAAATGLTSDPALQDVLERLAAFVPSTRGRYAVFHKSLADWLTRVEGSPRGRVARRFHIDKARANSLLIDWCWREYELGPETMSRYARLYLARHLIRASRHKSPSGALDRLRRAILDWRYLAARVATPGFSLTELIAEYEAGAIFAAEERDGPIHLIVQAIRLSSHVLALDPTQLSGQLLGRLRAFGHAEIHSLLERVMSYRGAPWLCPLTASLNPAGGLLRWTFRGRPAGHKGTVRSIAISDDGRWALTAGNSHADETVKLWHLGDGDLRWSWSDAAAAGGFTALALLETRWVAIASHGSRLQVWSMRTGARVCDFVAHDDLITALATSPDQEHLVSGARDGTIGVWKSAELPGQVRRLSVGAPIRLVKISDGRIHVLSDEGGTVWNLDSLDRVPDPGAWPMFAPMDPGWPGYGQAARLFALDTHGRYAVCTQDGPETQVWDLNHPEIIARLPPQGSPISAAAINPGGERAVTSHYDHDVKVWDVRTKRPTIEPRPRGRVERIVLLPDVNRVVVSHREPETGKPFCVWGWDPPSEILESRAIDPAIADADVVWTASRSRIAQVAHAIGRSAGLPYPRLLNTTSDGCLAVFSTGPRAKGADVEEHWRMCLWDVAAHCEVRRLSGHRGLVFDADFTADATLVASASEDATIKLWRVADGVCLATFTGDAEMTKVAITPDGKLIAAGDSSGRVHLLRVVAAR